jgi:hypothetical protein
MLRECLVYSSMRLGVPFIAPRQLGAVESIPGRQFLPSVAWRTGQSGAPDTVRCGFLSLFGEADRCRFRAVGAPDTVRCTPDTVRCTPDSPVPPSSRWPGHVSRADRAADRWPGRPLASPNSPVQHRTVRCTTGHCPVRISFLLWRSRPLALWSRWRIGHCPVHTGKSGALF